ncbi:uncharacterized protein LOC141647562 [Silene latifolia]|uniref:uncharacterized protein LOC141647562 n=1 Tax=Silene latifolia TaxID=37657 RepID=UPI003D76C7A6
MLKFVCKCSASSTNGFRPLRHLFSSSSYSSFSTKQQQQEAEHPSSSLPKFLVENLGFSEQQSLSISPKIAAGWRADGGHSRVSALTFAANANSVIHFFKSHGFNDSQIRNLVSCYPPILNIKLHQTLIPKFKVLQDLGISASDLISVISANPNLVIHRLDSVLQDFSELLGTPENLVSFLKKRRLFWANASSRDHLISNVRLLENDYGISTDIIRRHIVRHEGTFLRNSELFRKTLMEVEHKWGISPTSGMFLYGVHVFGCYTPELIESKIQLLKSFGWNQSHIMTLVKKLPHFLRISEARLTKSLEFLMNEMGYEPTFLACRPALLTCSLETRLLPRQRILVVLREKGLISTACTLYNAAVLTESKFFLKFVQPFKDDVPDLYKNYLSSRDCQTLGTSKTIRLMEMN